MSKKSALIHSIVCFIIAFLCLIIIAGCPKLKLYPVGDTGNIFITCKDRAIWATEDLLMQGKKVYVVNGEVKLPWGAIVKHSHAFYIENGKLIWAKSYGFPYEVKFVEVYEILSGQNFLEKYNTK